MELFELSGKLFVQVNMRFKLHGDAQMAIEQEGSCATTDMEAVTREVELSS